MIDAVVPPLTTAHKTDLWPQLRQAIATSSGFKRWTVEHGLDGHLDERLDALVSSYLRQTLETLAY
jgi:hypothetical protein